MPWVKLDDRLHDDPTLFDLSSDAFRLFICALTFCGGNLTDGHIPRRKAPMLAPIDNPADAIGELVDSGLWETTDDGYWVPNFLKFNPSKEDTEKKEEQAKERRRKWAEKNQQNGDETDADASRTRRERVADTSTATRREHCPDPTRPDPTLVTPKGVTRNASSLVEPVDVELCDLLADQIETNTGHRPKQPDAWHKDMSRLRRLGATEWADPHPIDPETIRRAIMWATRDQFWRSNIKSPGKLRDKWVTLVEQSKRAKPKPADQRAQERRDIAVQLEDAMSNGGNVADLILKPTTQPTTQEAIGA